MLTDGEEIRQDLGRMEFVGQAVPHRNAGVMGQFLHDLLAESAVLDAVKHTAENTGGIRGAFLLTHLGTGGSQVHRMHTQISRRYFKSAAGTGAVFLKQKSNALALAEAMRDAGLFLRLKIGGKIQKTRNLRRGKIQQLQEMLTFQ